MLSRRELFNPFRMLDELLAEDSGIARVRNTVEMTVSEDAKNYYVRAVVPGFKEDELCVTSTGNRLTVSGKREVTSEGVDLFASERESFERTFSIPRDAVSDDVSAESNNGILVVSIPKRKAVVPETKRIPIKS